ncbi:MAG: radical SAM protein [Anaerolineales bacterium]|nr:radical SAM protein [Anaerolineales bacterium]
MKFPFAKKENSSPGRMQLTPAAGTHSYDRVSADSKAKVHLRIEPSGEGLLLVDAAKAYHLNPTAASMAWLHLEGFSVKDAVQWIKHKYKISADAAIRDFKGTAELVEELIRPDGACPIHDLNLEILQPFSQSPSAPYRLDLAVTYRCNNDCAHCYNARPRSYPEMDTDSWKKVIRIAWDQGIPHIIFTGGEATLRDDLPQLIAYAQQQGQITGLLTNGRRLSNPVYLQELIDAGLDHVQITLESADAAIHDRMVRSKGAWEETVAGIRSAIKAGLYLMTNTTLLTENKHTILPTIEFLAELGVPTVGLNSLIYSGKGRKVGSGLHEEELHDLLQQVRTAIDRNGQRLVWYTPTQYCHFDPVQMELGVKSCTAARYNMCVEPDGSVIPCQSFYSTMGNILEQQWEEIWNHDLALWLRDRKYVPEACYECQLLSTCGGGCPLALKTIQPQIPITELVSHS